MQRLEVSGAVRPTYGSLGVKRLIASYGYRNWRTHHQFHLNKKKKQVKAVSH